MSKNLEDMTLSELRKTAEVMGIPHEGKKVAELRDAVKIQLGEPVEQPTMINPEENKQEQEKRITIILNESEKDKQPVQVGVQGRTYVMERGKPVAVPRSVVEVLKNAKRKVWNETLGEYQEVLRYPFQVEAF